MRPSTGKTSGRRIGPFFLPVFLLLLLLHAFAGCAAKHVFQENDRERQYQEKYYIEGVPFFRLADQESSCGPSALAGVISYWDRTVSMEQIVARVYLPRLKGSLPFDMQRFLTEEGFVTVSAPGTIGDVKAVVRRNVPVISLIDLGIGLYRRPHYVTVIGFDDEDGSVIVHDGLTANLKMTYGKFVKAWERADNWMLVAMPAEKQERL